MAIVGKLDSTVPMPVHCVPIFGVDPAMTRLSMVYTVLPDTATYVLNGMLICKVRLFSSCLTDSQTRGKPIAGGTRAEELQLKRQRAITRTVLSAVALHGVVSTITYIVIVVMYQLIGTCLRLRY